MKYFPPLDRGRPAWAARIRNLEGPGSTEDNPTLVAMSGYLLALDELCDMLNKRVKSLVKDIEASEVNWIKAVRAHVQTVERAATAENRATLAEMDLKEQSDGHSQHLRGVYLVDRAKRKGRYHWVAAKPLVLEGTPLYQLSKPRRTGEPYLPTPPTSPREAGDEDPNDCDTGPSVKAEDTAVP